MLVVEHVVEHVGIGAIPSLVSETCRVISSNLACEGVGCCRSSSRLSLGGNSCLITIRYSFKQPLFLNEVHPAQLFPPASPPPPIDVSIPCSLSIVCDGAERKAHHRRRHRHVFAHTARGIKTDGGGVREGLSAF